MISGRSGRRDAVAAGTDNGDGHLHGDGGTSLEGLTITPPLDSNEDFTLGVTATSTDGTE